MYINNEGPIPGENFTSDTKNYPWHQPPEFVKLDDALDMLSTKMTNFKTANGIITIAELGIPLYRITSMVLMAGIGEGKWTPDLAFLLAGPVTRMIELICIGFDVPYELGIDDDESFVTGQFFKNQQSVKDFSNKDAFEVLSENMSEIKQEAEEQTVGAVESPTPDIQQKGFMAMTSGNPTEEAPEEGTEQ